MWFHEYVPPTRTRRRSLREDFQDTEDLDGLFSGYDPETGTYDPASWQYEGVDERGGRNRAKQSASDRQRQRERLVAPGARSRPRDAAGTARACTHVRGPARRDAAAPALRVPGAQAALRPLHPGDGRADLRRAGASSSCRVRGGHRQQRPRADHRVGLLGRLDAPHGRRAVHPRLGDHPAAAGQHGPARRRHPRAARARQHPGLHRHPDAVQPAARLPADAARPASTTDLDDYLDTITSPEQKGFWADARKPTPSACSRRTGATRRRPRTTTASTTCRG